MKTLCMCVASALLASLCLSACSGADSDYPKEYVGFDKIAEDYSFDKKTEEQEISIKIIAAEKSDTDREAAISVRWQPGAPPVFKLLDTKAVIPAKQKSTFVRIRIYPRLIQRNEEIRIVCSPKDKEVKQTQLTLKLVAK